MQVLLKINTTTSLPFSKSVFCFVLFSGAISLQMVFYIVYLVIKCFYMLYKLKELMSYLKCSPIKLVNKHK